MKSKLIITLCFTVFCEYSYSQSGWFWKNPKYSVEVLQDIEIINNSTAYVVGETGTFLITTDAGYTWSNSINSSEYNGLTPERLFGCSFVNANTGWIVGNNGVEPPLRIFKTTNGGANWLRQAEELSYTFLTDVWFNNQYTGWASGQGYLLHTINSGSNWNIYNLEHSNIVEAIQFLNSSTGWTAGEAFNYKTTNGGLNWSVYYYNSGFHAYDVYFFNESTGVIAGWFTGNARIYKTTDGGDLWDQKSEDVPGQISSICFVNNTTGFAVGGNFSGYPQLILKTTNSGNSWQTINPNDSTPSYLCSVKFFNENTGITVGYNGEILRTTDCGDNWSIINSAYFDLHTNKVRFANELTGWLLGDNGLLKSTDGGTTWVNVNTGNQDSYKDCYLPNRLTAYCVSNNAFYKTTNGGVNWLISNFFGKNLNTMDFINSSTGYIAGYITQGLYIHTTQYKTTNSGISWDTIVLPSIYPQLINFYDENTGWLVGGGYLDNRIYKTTNQGLNWDLQYTETHYYNNLTSIYLLNMNTAWVSGDENKLLKTTDGGASWNSLTFGHPEIRYAPEIQFVNQNLGWALVNYPSAMILKTTNGGLNWYTLFDCGIYYLQSMYFLNRMTGWTSGDGILIKTTNGGELMNVINIQSSTPDIYSLSQNFPNPFNPITKIKFDIKKFGDVKLLIYDVLGREIATLVNEQLQPGTYEAEWDASNYSSGVYFYKLVVSGAEPLITSDYSETRKMVLIK